MGTTMSTAFGIRKPPCGNDREAHGPHWYARWSSDTEGADCPGWTQAEADGTEVFRAVLLATRENEAAHPFGDVPPLRLELHPAVRYCLAAVITVTTTDPRATPDLDTLFGVPLVIVVGLPPGGWRVITVGPVLREGTIAVA